ncbi:MAG: prepilin-type N-terminal cleavage/methylation domain-containing protein [Proteobacteria bacterium]|nr:prepilin-type N-terminal cleavage/methylation domain-containing protein [Pseudomonadota bacterium]
MNIRYLPLSRKDHFKGYISVLKQCHGFTLMEMIITIVILSVIALFTFSFFINLTKVYTSMESQRTIHQEAAYIAERISREIRDAKSVTVAGSIIAFQRSHAIATDSSSNIYVRFRLSGTDIYRDSGTSSASYTVNKIIGRNITNFTVTPTGVLPQNAAVQVAVSVSQGGLTQNYVTNICPKNYTTTGNCVFTGRDFGGCYEDRIY